MMPYRPIGASPTHFSNPPSSLSTPQVSDNPLDPVTHLSSRGTSPDVTSSASERSRPHIRDNLSHNPITSHSQTVHRSITQRPEPVDAETRPGPEDAEGSTRRWSFRSRKANQLQPYSFDRMQYKRQLQWDPDAVVSALSPPRRRSSPGSPMDQDFIADDDQTTQETGEFSGLTSAGGEESQSQSKFIDHPLQGSPSKASHPTPPPPQWFLDGMNEISEMDSDHEDVFGYLTGHSHKGQLDVEVNNDGKTLEVSGDWSVEIIQDLMCRQGFWRSW